MGRKRHTEGQANTDSVGLSGASYALPFGFWGSDEQPSVIVSLARDGGAELVDAT
jgi:hypothetical protein